MVKLKTPSKHITILRPKRGRSLSPVKGSTKVTSVTPLHRATGIKKGDVLIVTRDEATARRSAALKRAFDRDGKNIDVLSGRTVKRSPLGR